MLIDAVYKRAIEVKKENEIDAHRTGLLHLTQSVPHIRHEI